MERGHLHRARRTGAAHALAALAAASGLAPLPAAAAGTASAPAQTVRSVVVTALDEIGVPLGGEYPKPLTDEVVRAADVVVTMGCGDACPVYPGTLYLDWPIDDPAGLPLAAVRGIRDDIDARVRELLASLHSHR
jgi:ArsR family transcriptional regulator